jgi:predicted dehydrogenase
MHKKALFIGLGGAGQRHLRNFKQLYPDSDVAAIRKKKRTFEIGIDLKSNDTVDIVDKYRITEYEDIKSACSFEPDFAIVANPTSLHHQTAMELLENRIPVLLEKPACTENDNIQLVLQAAKKASVDLMVAYQLRFHPCVVEAKKTIESGKLGKIHSVAAHVHSYMPGWHPYEKYEDLYASKKQLGGGVILTEIHEVDLISWFFGLPDRVVAFGGKLSNYNIDVEDTVTSLMYHENKQGSFPLTLNMSFIQNPPTRNFSVFGELGNMYLDIPNDELVIKYHNKKTEKIVKLKDFDRNSMFVEELKHFINSISQHKQSMLSIDNTMEGQLLANAIKQSLNENQIVYL